MLTYDVVLFVHVLAAVGIFVGLALEWMLLVGLERAHTDADLGEALSCFAVLPVFGAPSTILVLASGIYLATVEHAWKAGWPVAALVALVLLAVLGAWFGGSRPAQLASRLLRARGTLPDRLRSALRSPLPRRSVLGRTWIAVGIVYLMAVKSALATSIVVLAISAAVAAATLVFHRRG